MTLAMFLASPYAKLIVQHTITILALHSAFYLATGVALLSPVAWGPVLKLVIETTFTSLVCLIGAACIHGPTLACAIALILLVLLEHPLRHADGNVGWRRQAHIAVCIALAACIARLFGPCRTTNVALLIAVFALVIVLEHLLTEVRERYENRMLEMYENNRMLLANMHRHYVMMQLVLLDVNRRIRNGDPGIRRIHID